MSDLEKMAREHASIIVWPHYETQSDGYRAECIAVERRLKEFIERATEGLRAELKEQKRIVSAVWIALDIATYEEAKPHTIDEHVAKLRAELAEARRDKERLDWLIKQGPPGAADGIGLNEESWELAVCFAEDADKKNTDQHAVRTAIDAAMSANETKEAR